MPKEPPSVGARRASVGARRFGYTVAVAINLVMLVVVNNILDWGWLPFLTEEFASLIWLFNVSLTATILANLVYMVYDPVWFKSFTQIGLNLISMIVLLRMLQVFPFDFSAYEFDWEPVARFVLILGLIGTGIGIIVEVVNLVRRVSGGQAQAPDEW
jgi:hypothetical protein